MEAILCEDLNLKEDQARLLRCKEYFSQTAAGDGDWNIENILLFLFDKWSAIRQECGKQMALVPSLVCDQISTALLGTCTTTTHWQEVHGSILGLSALIINADIVTDHGLFTAVSNLCIELIGHVSIPVKEAVRQCLITVQKRRTNKYELVNQLVRIINDTVRAPNHDSETVSLTLDGLLGCLVDNYNLFPQLMTPDAGSTAGCENSSMDVVATIRLCALHPASTVRQKAGQILTVFVLSCLKQTENEAPDALPQAGSSTGVVSVITAMLMEALRSTESAHWRLQEISLMVAEEVVCAVISAQLEKLETLASQGSSSAVLIGQSTAAESSLLQQACAFLDFLKNHLQVLLGHAQFEVRRMAIQLTPQLARAFVLLNAPLSALDKGTTLVPISFALDSTLSEPPPCAADQENLHNPSYASAESGDQIGNRISLGSRSDGSLEGENEEDCGALRVQLNSSFRSHAETEGAGPGLDLELVSRTVWLNELIKENQHLFEAYSLSESWACNSATKDLQLRSYSIKDESHRYWADSAAHHHTHGAALQPNRTVSSSIVSAVSANASQGAGGSGLARGVVDHWSLDVRGRLQEIEERAQFHRTVKAIVSTEVTAESCTVIVLLTRNCRSVLSLVDDLLLAWDTVFAQKGSWAAMTDFAASLNSLRSANTSATALTVDFVESLALLESFLLSVQYRFSQCPDIQAALVVADANAEGLITSAGALRQRLGTLRNQWIIHIARIQCVSRCSTHVSTRSGITGQAHQRPSATNMLLTILRQNHDCSVMRNDLFASVDHEERDGNDTEETAEKAVVRFVTKLIQAQMNVAESKEGTHHRGGAHAIEEIFCDMFSDKVILIPSITNASLSIGTGASSSFHSHANAPASTGGDAAHVLSPSHGVHHGAGSVASTPQSTAAHPKSAFSAGFSMHSPGSHLGAPHGYTGAIGGSHGRYQAMDQWNCEAVSPVLTCLANATSDATEALQLSAVVVEWVVACIMNPLWLDCRHNARKNLFEALVLLLSTAEKSTAEVTPADAVYCLLALKIVRAVAEVLALRGSKPLLEQKVLICLVKAAASAIKIFQRLETELRSVFVNSPGTAVAWSDVRNVQFRITVEECCTRISQSLQYYREVFPQPSPHSHSELINQLESTKAASSAATACDQAADEEDALEETESSSSSDEFSDWDEESEEDEDAATTTGLSATGDLAQNLGNILWEEMSSLQDQVDQWQLSSAF